MPLAAPALTSSGSKWLFSRKQPLGHQADPQPFSKGSAPQPAGAHWFSHIAGALPGLPRPPLDSGGGCQALQNHVPPSRGPWGKGGCTEGPWH